MTRDVIEGQGAAAGNFSRGADFAVRAPWGYRFRCKATRGGLWECRLRCEGANFIGERLVGANYT